MSVHMDEHVLSHHIQIICSAYVCIYMYMYILYVHCIYVDKYTYTIHMYMYCSLFSPYLSLLFSNTVSMCAIHMHIPFHAHVRSCIMLT